MFRLSQFAAPVIAGAMCVVGGCASDHPDEVPVSAQTMVEGTKTATTAAPHDGMVYIWDRNSDKMIYTGQVKKGDVVTVDAKKNRVMFNNMVASERDLVDDHNYKIFFERSKEPDAAETAKYKDSTVIQSGSGSTVVKPSGSDATIVTPAQPQPNTTIIQPAPAQQQPQPNTTIIQPAPAQPQSNTTVIQPAPSGGTTVVQPAPSGGSTTVVQPAR